MKQQSLSRWLKAIIIGLVFCGLALFTVIVPTYGKDLTASWPEFKNRYIPWLVFIWITGVPCFAALVLGWRIADRIGKDASFTVKNARELKWISRLAVGDSAIVVAGNLLLAFLDMNHPGVILLCFLIAFIGIAFAVAAAALSHLIGKAAVLQEQSDLTI